MILYFLDNSSKRKKSILYDKTFLVDVVDKVISSKVQKLIRVYGGVSSYIPTYIMLYYISCRQR